MASHNSSGSFFNRTPGQNYQEDCDMLFFCEKNAQPYRLCYKGTPLTSKRCTPAEKNMMLMFSQVVHRSQLMDETIKQLDSRLDQLIKSARSTPPQTRVETPRFEQSQAASLIGGVAQINPTTESTEFAPLFPRGGGKTPRREEIARRTDEGKSEK